LVGKRGGGGFKNVRADAKNVIKPPPIPSIASFTSSAKGDAMKSRDSSDAAVKAAFDDDQDDNDRPKLRPLPNLEEEEPSQVHERLAQPLRESALPTSKPTMIDEGKKSLEASSQQLLQAERKKTMLGPTIPEKLRQELAKQHQAEEEEGDDQHEEEPEQKRARGDRGRKRRKVDGEETDSSSHKSGYDQHDEKYAVWMPPSGQTGDGRTRLNDKLGY
jgi:hypothetical protein